jgi:hypothetical protein
VLARHAPQGVGALSAPGVTVKREMKLSLKRDRDQRS